MAKLVVTSRGWDHTREALQRLRHLLPAARVRRTPHRGVLLVDAAAEPDAPRLAEMVSRECAACAGHVTVVLAEVDSTLDQIRDAAREVGSAQIGEHETFCFRIMKRGAHLIGATTPVVESDIGGAIWQDLERRFGRAPRVDLGDPDVMVAAEVLGPRTAVGVVRRAWRVAPAATPES